MRACLPGGKLCCCHKEKCRYIEKLHSRLRPAFGRQQVGDLRYSVRGMILIAAVELEACDSSVPIKYTIRGQVLVNVPEGAIVRWINLDGSVIAPTGNSITV